MFGAVTGGVGAVINKEPGVNWKNPFVRGFWQGCVGGSLNFAGKKLLYQINKDQQLIYGWGSKLLHSAGTSIIYNAGLNEPFLQNWSIDYGPVKVDFSLNKKKKTRVRFLPVTIYSFAASAKNSRVDWKTSLLTGEPAFLYNDLLIPYGRDRYTVGLNYGRSFVYAKNGDHYFTIAHELVHSLQFREYQVLNTWLKPIASRIKPSKTKQFVEKTIYPDIPYMWWLYAIEGSHSYDHYFRNFFEFEAQSFSTNQYVPVR